MFNQKSAVEKPGVFFANGFDQLGVRLEQTLKKAEAIKVQSELEERSLPFTDEENLLIP